MRASTRGRKNEKMARTRKKAQAKERQSERMHVCVRTRKGARERGSDKARERDIEHARVQQSHMARKKNETRQRETQRKEEREKERERARERASVCV